MFSDNAVILVPQVIWIHQKKVVYSCRVVLEKLNTSFLCCRGQYVFAREGVLDLYTKCHSCPHVGFPWEGETAYCNRPKSSGAAVPCEASLKAENTHCIFCDQAQQASLPFQPKTAAASPWQPSWEEERRGTVTCASGTSGFQS